MADEMDFKSLFESQMAGMSTTIPTGKRVHGTIVKIGRETTFVNLGVQCDGIIDTLDLKDPEGNLRYQEGDRIEAVNMGWTDEGYKLALRASRDTSDATVAQAFEAKLPIEGKVLEERKGGYGVQVASVTGFCPYSQMDLRGVKKEAADYIGQSFLFMIQEYNEEGGRPNLVLTRRPILEAEAAEAKEQMMKSLNVGDVFEGTVVRIMPFGAFIDLGGIEGLCHVSEMSWNRGAKPESIVNVGDKVTVKVLDIDYGDGSKRERISLSMKRADANPWDAVTEEFGYAVGVKRKGTVTRFADFGAFIELAPGIEGLAHISQLGSDKRVNRPSDVLKIGQEVDVTILEIDASRRRISLCIGEPKDKKVKVVEAQPAPAAEEFGSDDTGASFGSIGDMFSGIEL